MQQVQSHEANFLLNTVYLPALKNEHRITKSVIDAIPANKCDYRPDTICKNALELARHIVSAEIAFLDAVRTGEFKVEPAPESIKSPTDLTDWYEQQFNERFHALTKLSDEQLTKLVDFRGIFQLPAVMFLNMALNHSIHHRGQLTMYLRPMGAKVPSIYGESYDAAQARKAAQQSA